MRPHIIALALLALVVSARGAAAQADVGAYGLALVSFQPVDDGYVGGPYLSEGIGGVGPGFGAGLSVIARSGLVVGGEYTTARFTKEQSGRLVRGGFPLEGIPATTRLHDSLLTAFVGYAAGSSTQVVILGGASFRLDRPTIDDVEAEPYDDEDKRPAPTGGIDILSNISSRARFVISARYTANVPDTRLQYLGIGPHILRGGVGIRIKLN